MTDKLPPGCVLTADEIEDIRTYSGYPTGPAIGEWEGIEDDDVRGRLCDQALLALKLAAKAPDKSAIEACEDIARQAFCEREKLINDGCDLCEIAEQTGRYQAAQECAKAIGKLAAKESTIPATAHFRAPSTPGIITFGDDPAPAATPFPDCKFAHCDLPGQCIAEGKCHHPKGREYELERENAELKLHMADLRDYGSRWKKSAEYVGQEIVKARKDRDAAQAQLAKVRTETLTKCEWMVRSCGVGIDYNPDGQMIWKYTADIGNAIALLHEEAKDEQR